MGVVFEAEKPRTKRRVALKVVRRADLAGEEALRMFEREAETLALMQHPNVATLFAAGTTEDGQPFFAMELVDGLTLDQYFRGRTGDGRAELEHRLELFRAVCDGVSSAHQRGVVHRDLKPGNVMVRATEDGSAPTVKILDFGLARITEGELAAERTMTRTGVVKGTIEYMSPEQASGDPRLVDARSDVYSLGVMLYQIAAGKPPYDTLVTNVFDALHAIAEEPPARMPRSWGGAVTPGGDLDRIARKALAKDPDERYASAAQLSDDITRFLTSQPIHARPPSAAYQLKKLVARHTAGAAAVGLFLAALIGFGIVMAVLYRRSVEAEEKATEEATAWNAVAEFLVGSFEVSDPNRHPGQVVTAREILDAGAARIDRGFDEQPEIQARLLHTMGQVYRNLGVYDRAVEMLERSSGLYTELYGTDDERTVDSTMDYAIVLGDEGELQRSYDLVAEWLPRAEELFGAEHPDVARWWNLQGRAASRLGDGEAALAAFDRAIELTVAARGPEHSRSLEFEMNRAIVLRQLGLLEDARDAYRAVLEVQERTYDPLDPGLALTTATWPTSWPTSASSRRRAHTTSARSRSPRPPSVLITPAWRSTTRTWPRSSVPRATPTDRSSTSRRRSRSRKPRSASTTSTRRSPATTWPSCWSSSATPRPPTRSSATCNVCGSASSARRTTSSV